jgi:hypothetical protein
VYPLSSAVPTIIISIPSSSSQSFCRNSINILSLPKKKYDFPDKEGLMHEYGNPEFNR